MKFSKDRLAKFVVSLIFLSCVLFANFYAVRKMLSLGTEVYFYDKLSVAYDIGKRAGLDEELKKILSQGKFPKEIVIAKNFEVKLKTLKDPYSFINSEVDKKKDQIKLIRNLRTWALAIIIFIFGWRTISSFKKKPE
ncbi:MAG: hypothetical protein AB1755_02070 [Candidatus Omnitrophota bacterium]